MNHSGEIEELVKLVRPDVSIITTVELAHSEFFENVEEIADAKAEIFTTMNGDGSAIINHDNPHYERLKLRAEQAGVKKIISFGSNDDADVRVVRHYFHDTCSCVIADIMGRMMSYKVGMLGYHWVMNSMAVLAAVDAVGADLGLSGLGLAELTPLVGRGRRDRIYFDIATEASFLLIDESYNANPASMNAAINTLGECENSDTGRKIAVLGDMAELGDQAYEMHMGLAVKLYDAEVDRIFLVGQHMKKLADLVNNQYPEIYVSYFNDKAALERALLSDLHNNDIIMVKGSNSSGMFDVVKKLKCLDINLDKQVMNG
jgi:UDP-N-acetylmuramoyl-tripeptide--D-alanyl-D-alanine ligase